RAPPPREQLRAMLRSLFELLLENRDFTRLILVLWMNPDVEVAATVGAFHERVEALIASSLEKGVRLGLVRKCDPALAAAALLGAVRGILGKLLESRKPPKIERVVDELIALAMRGIGAGRRW